MSLETHTNFLENRDTYSTEEDNPEIDANVYLEA
jgi:hypothetical protein